MKLKFPLVILFIVALFGCNRNEDQNNKIYIGGRIANPTSKYIILSQHKKNLDTFYLDKNNRFGGTLKTPREGLYLLKHQPENQMVYLQRGDSILIYLNTLSFDESLNFSGNGAEESNYLTNLYLLNQKNNDLIVSYYKIKPEEFAKKTDSIRETRKKDLQKLNDAFHFSPEFMEIAHSAINYEFYDLRERYLFLIRKYNHKFVNKIPQGFSDYRKKISFNDQSLQDYYLYLNCIDDYLRTKSIEYCDLHHIKNKSCYNLNGFENIKRRILLVDSLIQNENIRNNFLDRLTAQGIIFAHTTKNLQNMLGILDSINYSGPRKKDFQVMAQVQNSLLPGNNLGNLELINTKQDTIQLKNIAHKAIITFPWSVNYSNHHIWEHSVIQKLREKYPEVEFIGINIDKDKNEEWLSAIKTNAYNPEYEYRLAQITIDEKLLKNYVNKLIFINQQGVIVQEDAQLNSPEFENKILEFLNQ